MDEKTTKKRALHESQVQKAFIKWCRESGDSRLRWVHSTQTAGARSIPARMRAKQEGMLAGVADVFIPYPAKSKHGIYIEFKSPHAPKRSWNKPDQLEFRDWCREHGYAWYMVDNANDAIEIVLYYLQDLNNSSGSKASDEPV